VCSSSVSCITVELLRIRDILLLACGKYSCVHCFCTVFGRFFVTAIALCHVQESKSLAK